MIKKKEKLKEWESKFNKIINKIKYWEKKLKK